VGPKAISKTSVREMLVTAGSRARDCGAPVGPFDQCGLDQTCMAILGAEEKSNPISS
jgi:hypothetical protein